MGLGIGKIIEDGNGNALIYTALIAHTLGLKILKLSFLMRCLPQLIPIKAHYSLAFLQPEMTNISPEKTGTLMVLCHAGL